MSGEWKSDATFSLRAVAYVAAAFVLGFAIIRVLVFVVANLQQDVNIASVFLAVAFVLVSALGISEFTLGVMKVETRVAKREEGNG